MEDREVELLKDAIDRLSEDMHRRMDDVRELTTERHNQNVAIAAAHANQLRTVDVDIRSLTVQVATTNGIVKAHSNDLKELFDRPLPLKLSDLRWYIAIFLGGMSTVMVLVGILVAILHAYRLLPGQ